MNDTYITIKDAADLLSCSTRTVRRRIKTEGWDSHIDSDNGQVARRVIARKDVLAHAAEHSGVDTRSDTGKDVARVDARAAMSRATELVQALQEHTSAMRKYTASVREQQKHQRRRERLALLVGLPVFVVVVGVTVYALSMLAAAP